MTKKVMKRQNPTTGPKTLRLIVRQEPREPVTVPVTLTVARERPREPVTVFVKQLGPRRRS
jgi:hypothetical protein